MASSVGPAITNLIGIVQAAVPATISNGAVTVVFGELPVFVTPVTLQIIEVTGDQQPAEMGNNFRREEAYSIVAEIVTWAGDQNYTQRFDDVMTCFNALLVAIGNNPWLSSTGLHDTTSAVRFAEIGDFSIIPKADKPGQSLCSAQFHIRCSQRIDSLD